MSSAVEAEILPLHSYLEELPQELYDHIYNLTFTAETGIRYASKPPQGASEEGRKSRPLFVHPDHVGLLHVDRLSRKKFANGYFAGEGTVFVCDITGRVGLLEAWLTPWTSSVDAAHLKLIRDVRCVYAKCEVDVLEQWRRSEWSEENATLPGARIRQAIAHDLGLGSTTTLICGSEDKTAADLQGFQEFVIYAIELPPIRIRPAEGTLMWRAGSDTQTTA